MHPHWSKTWLKAYASANAKSYREYAKSPHVCTGREIDLCGQPALHPERCVPSPRWICSVPIRTALVHYLNVTSRAPTSKSMSTGSFQECDFNWSSGVWQAPNKNEQTVWRQYFIV